MARQAKLSSIIWKSFVVCTLGYGLLSVWAQTANTGAITGTVTDRSGAVVVNAPVAVNSGAIRMGRKVITDAEGRFAVQFLDPGEYDLTVQAPGFAPFVLNAVKVRITEASRLNIQLVENGAKTSINVEAPLMQTDNASLGRVIDGETITSLPLVDRNYTEILGLAPGTNSDIVDATELGAGSQEIRSNGARSGDNNFMINGVDANSYGSNLTETTPFGGAGIAIPAPETIQEFKVQNSLYDAQYGRGAGANVNLETNSGTAEFHGDAYYFGRNEALDANNFFADEIGVPKEEFRRSQPGGALGGPVLALNKRAFFFVSYQATRDVNAASLSSITSLSLPPIPLARTAAALGAIYGGFTGAFGGVAVAPDGSNINPVALNLLNAKNPDGTFVIPSPQNSGSGINYTAVEPGRYSEDQFNTNFDMNLRPADRMSVKFFFSNSNQTVPFFGATVPGFPALRSFSNRNLSISENHMFPSRAINQLRVGFSRLAGQSTAGGTLSDQDVGITRFSDPEEKILPNIDVLGAFKIGNSANDEGKTANNNFYIADVLFASRGKHEFRAGTELFRNQFNQRTDYTAGGMTFLSLPDFLLGLPGGPTASGGNGTFLSNIYLSAITAGIPDSGERSSAAHFFASDEWEVTPALRVELGIRVEADGQQSESHGHESNFFPQYYVAPSFGGTTQSATSGFVLPDNYSGYAPAGFPRGNATLLNQAVQVHPEPRVAFVWRPVQSRDFVLRGGYGIYANRLSFEGNASGNLTLNPPFALSVAPAGGANAAASLQDPFPNLPPNSSFPNFTANMLPGPPFVGNGFLQAPGIADPNLKEATVQQYDLDLQYQHESYLISLAYAGAKGTHLDLGRSNNQPALVNASNPVNGLTTNSVENVTERIPFAGLDPLLFRLESSGNSTYNSLQLTLKKAMSHGIQLLAAYTFSKSIDDAADSIGAPALGSLGLPLIGELAYNNQNDVSAQRSVSDFDRTHRFVLSYTWNLPKLVGERKGVVGKLANGWALSGIMTLQSGLPFSILDSAAGTLFGPATLYTTGDLAPGAMLSGAKRSGSVSSRVGEFFNTDAFAPAAYIPDGGLIDGIYPVSGGGTVFGTLGRNILRGPDQRDFDCAFIKTIPAGERIRLLFRWEIFNALNRPNFANPSNDVSTASTFGVISALTVNPRIMQYGLKLEF